MLGLTQCLCYNKVLDFDMRNRAGVFSFFYT